MKVLLVHNHYLESGGEDIVVEQELQMLRRKDHEVLYYERSNQEIREFTLAQKIKFVCFDILGSKSTYRDLKAILSDFNPDIAHVHNSFLVVTPSIYEIFRDSRIPLIQTLHNYRFLCPNGLFYRGQAVCEDCRETHYQSAVKYKCVKDSYLLSRQVSEVLTKIDRLHLVKEAVSRFIAPSEFCRNKYIENGFPEEKMIVKPNFILEDPGPSQSDEGYALFVGALREYKGVRTLLSAWERITSIPLKIVGDGPLSDEVFIKSARDNIEYLGFQDYRKVMDLIKKASFVVVPSECYETFSRVIMESYACQKPVIASHIGALAEIVDNGKTGLLFEPQNAGDLKDKVDYLVSQRGLMKEMGRRSRKKYEDYFTPERNYRQLMEIYTKAVN